jgi:major membrane immunogen (membrane-anchored lipoprotein)
MRHCAACLGPLALLSLGVLALGCAGWRLAREDWDAIARRRPEERYFTATLRNLHFLIETAEPARLDTVFRRTVADAKLPVSAAAARDGVYVGVSPEDAFGYRHMVRLRIQSGRITAVTYDEVTPDGHGKRADAAYCREMGAQGADPSVAYPMYEGSLLQVQDVQTVDAVSGATYSLYRFRYAVVLALIQAVRDH